MKNTEVKVAQEGTTQSTLQVVGNVLATLLKNPVATTIGAIALNRGLSRTNIYMPKVHKPGEYYGYRQAKSIEIFGLFSIKQGVDAWTDNLNESDAQEIAHDDMHRVESFLLWAGLLYSSSALMGAVGDFAALLPKKVPTA